MYVYTHNNYIYIYIHIGRGDRILYILECKSMCVLFVVVVVCAIILPLQQDRQRAGALQGAAKSAATYYWVFIKGGCSGRGVQWMGVALYNKTAYTIM